MALFQIEKSKNKDKSENMEIESDLCGVCEKCVPACPHGLIKRVGYSMKVDKDCVNCGECYDSCPLGAIFLE